jgi:hypothetical protein
MDESARKGGTGIIYYISRTNSWVGEQVYLWGMVLEFIGGLESIIFPHRSFSELPLPKIIAGGIRCGGN